MSTTFRLERPPRLQTLHHLSSGQHLLRRPAIAIPHIHVFDQAQLDASITGQCRQGNQLIIVMAALNHAVQLQLPKGWVKTGLHSCIQCRHHLHE